MAASNLLTTAEIDAFAHQLKATLHAAQLGAEVLQFLGKGSSATKPAGRPAAAPKVAKRHTRQAGLAPDKVLAGLTGAKDGLSLGALAEKLGEKSKDRVATALRKLREAKKAVVKGDRIKARWYAA